jgi:hypothetical protein
MCNFDVDDYCQVWNKTYPRAKKQHVCNSCRTTIQPGEQYLRIFSVYDGNADTDKACMVCATLWESFVDAHGSGFQPQMLDEMLTDCIADSSARRMRRWGDNGVSVEERLKFIDSVRKVDGQWRAYLAILLHRRRKAKRAHSHGNQEEAHASA